MPFDITPPMKMRQHYEPKDALTVAAVDKDYFDVYRGRWSDAKVVDMFRQIPAEKIKVFYVFDPGLKERIGKICTEPIEEYSSHISPLPVAVKYIRLERTKFYFQSPQDADDRIQAANILVDIV